MKTSNWPIFLKNYINQTKKGSGGHERGNYRSTKIAPVNRNSNADKRVSEHFTVRTKRKSTELSGGPKIAKNQGWRWGKGDLGGAGVFKACAISIACCGLVLSSISFLSAMLTSNANLYKLQSHGYTYLINPQTGYLLPPRTQCVGTQPIFHICKPNMKRPIPTSFIICE